MKIPDYSGKLLEVKLNLVPDLPSPNFNFPDIPIPDCSHKNLYAKIGLVPSTPFKKDILDIDRKHLFFPDNPNL